MIKTQMKVIRPNKNMLSIAPHKITIPNAPVA